MCEGCLKQTVYLIHIMAHRHDVLGNCRLLTCALSCPEDPTLRPPNTFTHVRTQSHHHHHHCTHGANADHSCILRVTFHVFWGVCRSDTTWVQSLLLPS